MSPLPPSFRIGGHAGENRRPGLLLSPEQQNGSSSPQVAPKAKSNKKMVKVRFFSFFLTFSEMLEPHPQSHNAAPHTP